MPSSEKTAVPIAEAIEEQRLKEWREKRAKVAEKSRQERLKQAEAEQNGRLRDLDAEKARRVQEAADKRARDEAAKRAERMNAARGRIAGRTDIDAARKRIAAYRRREARKFIKRIALCVALPTILTGIYLFSLATPLYVATATLAIAPPTGSESAGLPNPFASTSTSQQAHQLKAFIEAPDMMATLEEKDGFITHFSGPEVDALTKIRTSDALQISHHGQFSRFVSVSVNGQEGLVDVTVKAADPAKATAFATTILQEVEGWSTRHSSGIETLPNPITIVAAPTASDIAMFPRRIPTLILALVGFASLYAMLSIFASTLVRHGRN